MAADPAMTGFGAVERDWRPGRPVHLRATLGPFLRGPKAPTARLDAAGAFWLAARTPDGAGTLRIALDVPAATVAAAAWGPGAPWLLDRVPRLLGDADDVADFDPGPYPLVVQGWRRYGDGWRVPASGLVLDVLIHAVIEQKVTGLEAARVWGWLLRQHGDPAPGPAPEGMYVLPSPAAVRLIPSWEWHRAGFDGARLHTVLRCFEVAGRLNACADLSWEQARRRLMAVPGVGAWTAAEVAQRALGDPDAVSFGDAHVAQEVVYALTGDRDGDDAAMAELLTPYAGHRYRAVRMVELSGVRRPRRGPRATIREFRSL